MSLRSNSSYSSSKSLFGQCKWYGTNSSPLLFTGQYEDTESGWAYNRFRYYNATFGMYNAQDPLGAEPNIANPQGYVSNPTTWMDPLGLHPRRSFPDNRPIQPDAGKPLRAGKYQDLGTIGHTSTADAVVPLERHHIVSADALKRAGQKSDDALAVQMTPSQHRQTMSWGSSKQAQAYRDAELKALQTGDTDDLVLEELARIEAMGGDNVGSAYEALDLYIKNGIHQP